MLKKIIAASAALAFLSLFACSSDDNKNDDGNKNSSSSTEENSNQSSSSEDPAGGLKEELIAGFAKASIFDTWAYSYTIVGGANEDLTQFWTCSPNQDETPAAQISGCMNRELMATNAILQNTLTTIDAPLRYKIDGFWASSSPTDQSRAIALTEYRLVPGSQAALGVNVYDPEKEDVKNIGQKPTKINNAQGFLYKYSGGAHVFRAVVNENKFWFVEVPAAPGENPVPQTILFEDFMAGTRTTTLPFNLLEVTQFLWVVEYDPDETNNTGSLKISNFNALVP